jgi:hypothetical protein
MAGNFTTSTAMQEPWEPQRDYLKEAFKGAQSLYQRPPTPYFPDETLAGFDPYQTMAQESMVNYATGERPKALQAGAWNANLDQLYGHTPFTAEQQRGLLAGDVNMAPFNTMANVYGNQALNQLTGKILPGIRESIVNYQPGGGARANQIQATAISGAQKNLQDQLATMAYNAYQGAQDQRMPMANMILGQREQGLRQYPTTMNAPLGLMSTIGDVGAERRAMTQEDINQAMLRYNYASQAPQQNLQNYLANISGNFGGVSSATPSPLSSIGQLGQLALGFMGLGR